METLRIFVKNGKYEHEVEIDTASLVQSERIALIETVLRFPPLTEISGEDLIERGKYLKNLRSQ